MIILIFSLSAHSSTRTSNKLWKNGNRYACSDYANIMIQARRPRRTHTALSALFALAGLLLIMGLLGNPVQAREKRPKATQRPPIMLVNPEVQAFIDDMQARHGFEPAPLSQLFETQRPDNRVIRIMAPAPVQLTPDWQSYRARFVNSRRINRGLQFWEANAETLHRAAETYGVPPEIIVAIIGVETEYGRNMGNFNIFNALATIGFYGERRREFFRSELEQYLLLARDNSMDLTTTRGSFAGALGIPQFMPSSQRRWGVDFDGDGKVDLIHSPTDAIGSVGNFLKSHGWIKGETAVISVIAPDPLPEAYQKVDIKPAIAVTQFRDSGFGFGEQGLTAGLADAPATLVSLSSPKIATQYWLGFNNYYVVTRYNRSAAYAMSVIELAEAIRQARGTPDSSATTELEQRIGS